MNTVASFVYFLLRKRLWVSVFRRLGEPHSSVMKQQAQLLAFSERINVAGDHFKKLEEHPAIEFHGYIKQVKKKIKK